MAPYDIALLKLKAPLKLNDRVKAVKLPEPNSLPNGTVILSGWGSTSTSSFPSYPNALQKVNLTVVDLVTCKRSMEALIGGNAPLHESNVCTGPLGGGISACSVSLFISLIVIFVANFSFPINLNRGCFGKRVLF